jgi:predicted RNA-binding Zn ribbon-like protein
MNTSMTDLAVPTASDARRRPTAPGRLELIRQFLNTTDIEAENDEFATPDGLAAWLFDRRLLQREQPLSAGDLATAVRFREALREMLEGNADRVQDGDARRRLDRIARSAPLRLSLRPAPRLVPVVRKGIAPAIGQLLAVIHEAMTTGTWERLKICRNDACRWAFYDSSRNRSGVWCTMKICGNRMKGRSFRQRHAG